MPWQDKMFRTVDLVLVLISVPQTLKLGNRFEWREKEVIDKVTGSSSALKRMYLTPLHMENIAFGVKGYT
ncbi:hypothetical protein DSO57_1009107 [Entomophthora muscae]|uniref:Uncharacterized protein n=1 Tax=Entomophthora muscae TaxID=34485 RepID=A0ACC2RY32_9FUNG|nr:hypothetical protein DSO57_1009107 [Entomophthora muscae]